MNTCPNCKTALELCGAGIMNGIFSEKLNLEEPCNMLKCNKCGHIAGQCPKTNNNGKCAEISDTRILLNL